MTLFTSGVMPGKLSHAIYKGLMWLTIPIFSLVVFEFIEWGFVCGSSVLLELHYCWELFILVEVRV